MKSNKILIALVIIFGLGLIAQSVYTWRLASDYKDYKKSALLYKTEKPTFKPPTDVLQGSFSGAGRSAQTPVGWASQFDPLGFDFFGEYDPFHEMEKIQQRMNRMFRDSFSRATNFSGPALFQQHAFFEPEIDMDETKTHYLIQIDLPGMEKDQIHVEVKNHFLIVSGNRKIEKEEADEQRGFYRSERSFGSFSRAVPLPAGASQDDIQAVYKNGVLAVKIAKVIPQAEEEKKEKPKIEVR